MQMYCVLDLFSGIGAFTLGLERTGGFKTMAFCEIDDYCRRVLAKHWPGVPIYGDIRELTAERLRADGIEPDVLCGGFPCQDISIARGNNRGGLDGERSGLWAEYSRLIGEIRPRFAIMENVAGLLSLGLDRVLGDLATLGFNAEWHCIPAGAIGAPHIRDRIWMVCYPDDKSQPFVAEHDEASRMPKVGNTDGEGLAFSGAIFGSMAQEAGRFARLAVERPGWWSSEPGICRVAHGIPSRMDRLRALGNAVVPQIPELIGRTILQAKAS